MSGHERLKLVEATWIIIRKRESTTARRPLITLPVFNVFFAGVYLCFFVVSAHGRLKAVRNRFDRESTAARLPLMAFPAFQYSLVW